MKSLAERWRYGQQVLADAGLESPRLEARMLLEWVAGCSHAELLMRPESLLPEPADQCFEALLSRRAAGEPLAYVLGEAEFRGRVFQVSPAVLIPRGDTEVLIDVALERLAGVKKPRVVDLGTGSGIVAISLALECPGVTMAAVDLSEEALSMARTNAGRLGATIDFYRGDWLAPLASQRFDLIVSNPPYVAAGDPHLGQNGLPFEPQMALTDGQDGFECIRRIVADAPHHLSPGGWLLFEHGYDQGSASRNLLTAAGFKSACTFCDLSGNDRVSGAHL